MALFTIADLHLSLGVEKPMDIFGGKWQGYVEKIEKNFNAIIKEDDVVVIPGDISWGINLEEAKKDLKFLNELPGKKIIVKGNHDLWWTTIKKMNNFLQENGFNNIFFLHNNCYMYEDIALCGTRGWFFEENFKEANNQKIFNRELMRLEASLKDAVKNNADRIYCFLHYPPLYINFLCTDIIDIMKKYGVTKCFYGHLHGESLKYVINDTVEGIRFCPVSADYINFIPILLKK